MAAPDLVLLISSLVAIFVCVVSVDLRQDINIVEEPEERECHGTTVGLGYSGTLEFHYQQLRKRYTGCTYINGNLEITNIQDPSINYDLSFLQSIRYVSGYVLLGLITEVEYIPLNSLEVIRGNRTFRITEDDYSLVVVLTTRSDEGNSGLKELHMPQLKEISNGKVLFTKNPFLGFINTIDWTPIMRGHPENVHFLESAFDESAAGINDSSLCLEVSRWGDSPSLCQNAIHSTCHDSCDGLCYGEGQGECCHSSCAVGCTGSTDQQCHFCKDYLYDGQCVGYCPAKSYPKLQNCIKY